MTAHDDRSQEARDALAAIDQTRRDTAHTVASPKGYYALAGFGQGVATIGIAMDHPAGWAVLVFGLGIVLAAMSWYTKHTGVVAWATLTEPGAWRAWVMAGVAIAGVAVAAGLGLPWGYGAGAVTFLTWAALGPAWDADWVRSIERQP